MVYKVIEIEGVGQVYADKLTAAGIDTVDALLENCRTPRQREQLAEATGIPEKLILRWANHADLMRIDGIGPQTAELFEAAGVDTVKELRHRNAANLAARIAEVNEERHITGRVPFEKEVERMIEEAKATEPYLEY